MWRSITRNGDTPVVIVRMASSEDAEELARMRYAFRADMNTPVETEDGFVARCAAWMATRLAGTSGWHCWVTEGGEKIAGQLWLSLIEKVPNPGAELEQHAYITNVYVRAEARGDGAGAALMEAALAFCREERVDSVILWPTERSRTLYARHGFGEAGDIMEAVLDRGRD